MGTKGLLLLNLGSPASFRPPDVGRYLNEFLTDRYVIDLPAVLRYPLVYGWITPRRVQSSAWAYQSVWREEGAPLTHFTRSFAEGVTDYLSAWQVRWAMRYGQPNCAEVLRDWRVDELYVVPLYPQYAESSTRTAVEQARRYIKAYRVSPQVFWLQDFFANSYFIESQARQIKQSFDAHKPERLLLSFHGLPEHHLTRIHPAHCLQAENCCAKVHDGNLRCYRAQAIATAGALREHLGLSPQQVHISFQSRLGRRPWIKPYTDHLVSQLAAQGVKRLLVSCPSFVADCLETLEEVEIRLKDQFLSEGGEALHLVPALNAEPHWIENFVRMTLDPALPWQPLPV